MNSITLTNEIVHPAEEMTFHEV